MAFRITTKILLLTD